MTGHSPVFAAFGPSRLAKMSHLTCPEETFSQVPATGNPYDRNASALLVPVKRGSTPADQGRSLGCGLARRSSLAKKLELLRDEVGSLSGRSKRLPDWLAIAIPPLTPSIIRSRSYSATVARVFSINRPVDVAGSTPPEIDRTPMSASCSLC